MAGGAVAMRSVPGGAREVSLPKEERKPKRKSLKRMSIERAANGGYSVEHHYAQDGMGPYQDSTTHAFGADDHQALLDHVKKHLGINRKMAAAAPPEAEGSVAPGSVDDKEEGEA